MPWAVAIRECLLDSGEVRDVLLRKFATAVMQAADGRGDIHHDLIVEKLAIGHTLGLLAEYCVGPGGPPRQLESCAAPTSRRGTSETVVWRVCSTARFRPTGSW
jgi:hypothetical protein